MARTAGVFRVSARAVRTGSDPHAHVCAGVLLIHAHNGNPIDTGGAPAIGYAICKTHTVFSPLIVST